MQRAKGSKKNLILTLWLCLPFLVLAAIVAVIFISYPNQKMDARPVGAGAGDTGGANALGQLLAGRDPDEIERTARDLREGKLIDPIDWPHGINLTIKGLPKNPALLFTWDERGTVSRISTFGTEPFPIEREWIESAYKSATPTSGFYLSTGNVIGRDGLPSSEDGSIFKLEFPPVEATEAQPGEPVEVTIHLPQNPDD